jgi:RND family efflux transporter MFP subunit
MPINKGNLVDSISASGTIFSAKVENVSSSVSCPIEKIQVEVGDEVKAGQLMAVLDMESVYTEFDKAQSTLNASKRDLDTKTKDFEINQQLFNDGGVSQQDLDNSEIAVENAKETYRNAETNYNRLKNDLEEGNIVAPISGTVTESNAEVGLEPPDGILFVVEDIKDLYVTATVKEFNIGSIQIGQDVLIQTNVTGSKTFKGKLSYISPKAVSEPGATDVEFEIKVKVLDYDPLMKIGMNAFLEIILISKEDVYSVPFDAVVSKPNGENAIYAVKENVVVEIPVETGIENATFIEVSGDGLEDGLIIVPKPSSVTVGQTITTSGNNMGGARSENQGQQPEGYGSGGPAGRGTSQAPSSGTSNQLPAANRPQN